MNNLRAMDKETFNLIIDEYSNDVYKFCRSLTYSREDRDDLFQETFLKAFEQREKMGDNPKGFLLSTAFFLWKSWKRKYARRNRLAPVVPLEEGEEGGGSPEADFFKQEEIQTLRALVEHLPDKFKIPVVLFYSLDLKVPAIACILNIPEGTVKSRLHKGRKLIEKGFGAQ